MPAARPICFSNGSGCGNETATNRPMVRRYLMDSVAYWAQEYHIDGFRFDLMGLHDLETMRAIRERLDGINPQLLMYGEGAQALSADRTGSAAEEAFPASREDAVRAVFRGRPFVENSYNSPDSVNSIKWDELTKNRIVFHY